VGDCGFGVVCAEEGGTEDEGAGNCGLDKGEGCGDGMEEVGVVGCVL
jgi:hypothetical protein